MLPSSQNPGLGVNCGRPTVRPVPLKSREAHERSHCQRNPPKDRLIRVNRRSETAAEAY
jgi:hypothetical protein